MATLLLVEDEFLVRDLLVEDLTEAGYSVIEAATADEGWALLSARSDIDGIVTDVRMPGQLDGSDLGRLAIESRPGMPVVYVTGFAELKRRLGPNERLIYKPYKKSDLFDALRDLGVVTNSS